MAALLAALFVTFLLQIFARHVMVQPFGWTLELCLVLGRRGEPPLTVGLIATFGRAAIGTPIGYAIIVGAVVHLTVAGQDATLAGEQIPAGLYESFVLRAVPLFIVAANLMNAGAISERLLRFCVAAVGRYPRGYAAAITAASATIGPIIPPSIPMGLYALVANTSIGFLLLGGILPGLLTGLMLMVMNHIAASRRRFAEEDPVPLRSLPGHTLQALPALLILILFPEVTLLLPRLFGHAGP